MKKKTEPKEYKNMPLPTDLYDQVKLISETNGYGERGMGAQVAHWVGQELPECSHNKQPVSIEYFPNGTALVRKIFRSGYYCPTCKRVYAKVAEAELVEQDGKKLLDAVKVKS